MEIINTALIDCKILLPSIHNDSRGYFLETYNQIQLNKALNCDICFVQDNTSFSTKGVLRGLHFQKGIFAQSKLIRVVSGSILDVVVDLREKSPTFLKHFSVELSETNQKQLFVPRGFAHGFVVLSDNAHISYKCDNFYNKDSEGGVLYNDRDLGIDWKLEQDQIKVSDKDLELPSLSAISIANLW